MERILATLRCFGVNCERWAGPFGVGVFAGFFFKVSDDLALETRCLDIIFTLGPCIMDVQFPVCIAKEHTTCR